jgi:hypothetical protein
VENNGKNILNGMKAQQALNQNLNKPMANPGPLLKFAN